MIAAIVVSSILYRDVPADVVSISAFRWRAGTAPAAVGIQVTRAGDEALVTAAQPGTTVVRFARANGTYTLDGPFEWPSENGWRSLDPRPRRTLGGASSVPVPERPPLQWMARVIDAASVWPSCYWASETRWQCDGIPVDTAGVVVANIGSGLQMAVVNGQDAMALRTCGWGRLLVVNDAGGLPDRLHVVAQRAVISAQRTRGIRLETAGVPEISVRLVDAGSAWICGTSSPSSAWLDVRSARGGPVYVDIDDVSAGSASIPMPVDLADTRGASGIATSSTGGAAGGTLVTVFRLIEPAHADRESASNPRRVLAGETLAAADGTFEVRGIGEGAYEIVAWHPQFGRATIALPPGSAPVTIRLKTAGTVQGRVVSRGKPVAGIDVISVPDPAAFQAADDPLTIKGGDARTAADGRFTVALASAGGGELRVGGGAHPIKRIPLPRAPLPLVDLGDIELGNAIDVNLVLDRDPGCGLRAVGPVGRAGLQILAGERTAPGIFRIVFPEEGTWAFTLLCAGQERMVSPSTFVATSASQGKDVRVIVR